MTMFSLLPLEERNGILITKGKIFERDILGSIWGASSATRITLVCFWKLKFYRNRKKIHTYMNENIYYHHHSLFSVLQSLKTVTILLSQGLKTPSQFKFFVILSGSLLGCGSFQICAWEQHRGLSA